MVPLSLTVTGWSLDFLWPSQGALHGYIGKSIAYVSIQVKCQSLACNQQILGVSTRVPPRECSDQASLRLIIQTLLLRWLYLQFQKTPQNPEQVQRRYSNSKKTKDCLLGKIVLTEPDVAPKEADVDTVLPHEKGWES